jgi:hypothetical protein
MSLLARLVGHDVQTYLNWKKDGLVAGPRADFCTELDAIEVAALATLLKELGPHDGRMAWKRVRGDFLADIPAGRIRVIAHLQDSNAELSRDDTEVGKAVSHGRLVRVVEIGGEVNRVRDAFRREVADQASKRERRSRRGRRTA